MHKQIDINLLSIYLSCGQKTIRLNKFKCSINSDIVTHTERHIYIYIYTHTHTNNHIHKTFRVRKMQSILYLSHHPLSDELLLVYRIIGMMGCLMLKKCKIHHSFHLHRPQYCKNRVFYYPSNPLQIHNTYNNERTRLKTL